MSTFTNSSSVYVVNNPKAARLFQENPKLNQFIHRKIEKEVTYSINERNISLTEIELNIDALEFIEKVRTEGDTDLKLVSCHFMRSICIRNISELCPLIDVYFALKNLTPEMKKIVMVEDPCVPGLNQKVCIVEYNSHQYAKKALNVLNSLGNSNRFAEIFSTNNRVEAVFTEPLVDSMKETLKRTPFAYFENLLINNYNLFHFKQSLEEKLKDDPSFISIKKIRQFSNKVLVEFSQYTPSILFTQPLVYQNKIIPVIPAMRPNLNVGKYKDKQIKASCQFLNEEDKKTILSRFVDAYSNDSVTRKKAEGIYNRILQEEKKEKKEKEEKESKETSSIHKKRERNKDEDYEEKHKERYKQPRKEASTAVNKRDRKDRDRSEERSSRGISKTGNSAHNGNNGHNAIPISTSTINNSGNPNLSQLSSLLLSNPNSANVLQNLSVLGNLQNLIANPTLVTMLQQLINPISSSSLTNISTPVQNKLSSTPTTNNTQPNNTNTSSTNTNQPPQSNFSSSQVNPIYNIPKSNHAENVYYPPNFQQQSKNFYPSNSSSQQFPFSMGNEMYLGQMPFGGNNLGGGGLNSGLGLPDYSMHQQNNEMEMDPNLMKKYYDYFQNMNK